MTDHTQHNRRSDALRPGGRIVDRTLRVRNNVDRSLRERRRHAERADYDGRHTECACYNDRRGLTLVELLVVIVILTMITAATIPLMAPVTGERKVRESARLLSSLLAQAQARALSSGRPVGVWIERLSTDAGDARVNHAIDLALCESPPPFSGLDVNARCMVSRGSSTEWVVNLIGGESIPSGWIYPGDRIRFNYRGPTYQITRPAAGGTGAGPPLYPEDGSLTGQNMAIAVPPIGAQPPIDSAVAFQIYRQPTKTADEPVSLPVGALIDLAFSGIGNGTEFGVGTSSNPLANSPAAAALPRVAGRPRPIIVLFGPSGNLDSVYYARLGVNSRPVFDEVKLISPVYLLVGQSPPETVDPANVHKTTNLVNQQNVWVAINPQSGLVTTSEVAIGPDYWEKFGVTTPQLNDYIGWQNDTDRKKPAAIYDSRAFARSSQNMGGR